MSLETINSLSKRLLIPVSETTAYLTEISEKVHVSVEKCLKVLDTGRYIQKINFPLYSDLLRMVLEYNHTKTRLLPWIHLKKLDWKYLSRNPHPQAIELLERKIEGGDADEIDWYYLSRNPSAIELLEKHPSQIWWRLNENPNPKAIELLKKYPKKIRWEILSKNPNAIELLEKKIEEDPEKIDWVALSSNPNAIELLKENMERIDWTELSSNPNAIELLKENHKRIIWEELYKNPNAIEILKESPKEIDWFHAIQYLSENPKIFETYVDYSEIDKIQKHIEKEVVRYSVYSKDNVLLKSFDNKKEARVFALNI